MAQNGTHHPSNVVLVPEFDAVRSPRQYIHLGDDEMYSPDLGHLPVRLDGPQETIRVPSVRQSSPSIRHLPLETRLLHHSHRSHRMDTTSVPRVSTRARAHRTAPTEVLLDRGEGVDVLTSPVGDSFNGLAFGSWTRGGETRSRSASGGAGVVVGVVGDKVGSVVRVRLVGTISIDRTRVERESGEWTFGGGRGEEFWRSRSPPSRDRIDARQVATRESRRLRSS
jgi:hypothetical protein